MNDIPKCMAGWSRRQGATDEKVAEAERSLKVTLPSEYVRVIQWTDGGSGFVGNCQYLVLWSIGELASMNKLYEVENCAPGLLIFGSDGGGEAYGFDTRAPLWSIVQVPFVGMTWTAARPRGTSFYNFLEQTAKGE